MYGCSDGAGFVSFWLHFGFTLLFDLGDAEALCRGVRNLVIQSSKLSTYFFSVSNISDATLLLYALCLRLTARCFRTKNPRTMA